VDYGFEQRVRNENWENSIDFDRQTDDRRTQVRYRSRAWFNLNPSKDFGISLALNQETNQIITPDRPFNFDEIILETAYLDFKKLGVDGLSLRVGRQNLVKGEGFMILDGGPLDGSRSIYFNAAVIGYQKKGSKFELIGILNPAKDRFLPQIHDRNRSLLEWDEQGVGAYYTDKNLPGTSIEAYYFLKKELNDLRASTNPQFNPGRSFHTFGGRVDRKLPSNWSVTGEWAFERGHERTGVDVSGWGGYGYAKRAFGASGGHYLKAGYWLMSGDDPATAGRNEGWDPLFSRWPKWSELYIYTFSSEKGPSYWTNTDFLETELGLTSKPWLHHRLTYYHLSAFHPFGGKPTMYGSGETRGDMIQWRTDVKYRDLLTGHILYERLAPGNFYSKRDAGWFLRFEVIFNVHGKVEL